MTQSFVGLSLTYATHNNQEDCNLRSLGNLIATGPLA